ncbi:hypothetical protein SETIT_8G137000v2 [Setaria italica]|uniref:Cathepsin propeptide inhibitor domain-containing protein n=1 Tax=Setaria italica TaxID=4555 RepID=A0A368S7P7_SETIT|nr:hypothetical protein SETIT_8G137000v2 [Setaria italica]
MAATLLSSSMALALLPLLLLAAASIPSLASASPSLDHGLDGEELLMLGRFHGWMAAHGRSYANEEEKLRRLKIYRSNMELIEAANQDGRMSYQLGETPFTDLTNDEFMAQSHRDPRPTNLTSLPASIDWRMMGVVTAARNQGACVPSLQSEQQLVDCDGYDLGCRGGFLGNAFPWVIQIGGIIWAPLYPYIGMSGMCQRFKPAAVRLRSYRWVVPNEVSLMQAVAQQPVAVTI